MGKITTRLKNILRIVEDYQQEIEDYGLEQARLLHSYDESEIIKELQAVL